MQIKPLSEFVAQMDNRKKVSILYLIVLGTFTSFISLIPAYFIKTIFDNISSQFNVKFLALIICALIFFFCFNTLMELYNTYYYIKLLNTTSINYKKNFVRSFLSKEYTSISRFSEGDILYRGNNDIQNVCELSFELIIKTITQLVFLVGIVYFMFESSAILSTSVIILMIIEYLYNYLTSDKLKSKLVNSREADSNLLEIYKQLINRYIYIRLNKLEEQETGRFSTILKSSLEAKTKYIMTQSVLSGVSNIIGSFRQIVVIVIGAYLISHDSLTIGTLIAFNQLGNSLTSPVSYFSNFIHFYKNLGTSFERVQEIIQSSVKEEKYTENQELLLCDSVGVEINGNLIINECYLKVEEKEKIAIIGESGSGKSTLCKLIAGLYNHTGIILLNSKLKKSNGIGFMLDESAVFRGSLWDNLTYGIEKNKVEQVDVYNLLDMVNLSYLYNQSNSLSNIIDKNMLSKGEKQRLELARLMILKPDLIILDEPTSGLDSSTEQVVWENFRNSCRHSTILYTTHNRSIIKEDDRILEMKGGLLKEVSRDNTVSGDEFELDVIC